MPKEMYISSSPHETKVAVLEDDQLVEVYFERDTDVGLVGGIYKGRVSRVLPGMQSAFVDIGLERDAFLYVSDFYEDQEEYDKVFEEAEARATKFTTQQAQAPTPEQGPVAPPPLMEPALPVSVEIAPAPPVVTMTPPMPAYGVESSPVAAPAAVAPPIPFTSPSAPREPRDRGSFDPRRGRRRRHRGRPDFREGRPSDRHVPPVRSAEESPSESPGFQVLPGESLAKYRNAAPAPIEEAHAEISDAMIEEMELPGSTADAGDAYRTDDGDAVVEIIKHDSPGVETVELSSHARPVDDASAADFASAATPSAQAPAAPITTVVTEAAPRLSPSATQATVDSSTSAGGELSKAALNAGSPEFETAASAVEEPVPANPASPSFVAEVAASYSVEGIAGPPSGEPETTSAPEAATAEGTGETGVAPSHFVAALESASERAELEVLDEDIEGEEDLPEEEGEELDEDAEGEAGDESGLPTEIDAGGQDEVPAASQAAPSDDDSASRVPAAPGDRSYTLREPSQRPKFAPRRRRGRRGAPGGGGDRGPRRSDKPRESPRSGGNHHPVQIAEVLKEGQEILVQIAKEPLGTKGARITSHVALPGRYLVFMPTIDHIGVSRKIASEEERLRLRNIILENKGPLNGGFIVRTAGQGRSEEEFKADLKFLSTLWSEIRSKSDRLKAPALLHRDLDLVQRLLRDLLTPDFKCVRVDSEIDYERVLDFVNRCQPALVGKVKLYTRDTPLYEEFGIQAELDKALKPKVWLKSGGYIVINQTEALVAVDVNTGKYVGKTNRLEDTIVKTNVDAVKEIVRQVRLRDLGGIIVIDFIDMDERKNRARVVQALEEALRLDRAPTKVISFHDFGLVAVTRKRVKQSLERTLCEPCTYCTGAGWVKSVNTVCNEIMAEARKMAKGIESDVITLRVNPEVAKGLKSRDGGLVSELESLTRKDVIIKSDPTVHQERFEIY